MKNKIGWFLLGLLVLSTALACKSTPPEEETLVEETAAEPEQSTAATTAPDSASLDALNAAAARAAAARKLVSDFDGPSLFPQDWQAAESLYSQAEQQKKTATRDEVQESTTRYNNAADAFDAMSGKTFAKYYENVEKELTDARNAVINAGAREAVPDYLLEVDNVVADARKKYEAKDYYGAKAGAEQALAMYAAGKAGLDAYNVRGEIARRGFEKYDPQNVKLCDDSLTGAANDYLADNFTQARDEANTALLGYNQALRKGWESYAGEKRAAASADRQKALDLKANVAVRQEYNSAQTVYSQANTAFQARKFDEAARLYTDCQASFVIIARTALEKRLVAEDALEKANQKMAESDETAKNAEVILEGGAL